MLASYGLPCVTRTQEDSTNIKSHPTTTRPNKQARKTDVRDCLGKQSVYTHLVEGQPMYVRDCQGKNCIYVSKHKSRQGRRLKSQAQSE
jgi:hypothetical protein